MTLDKKFQKIKLGEMGEIFGGIYISFRHHIPNVALKGRKYYEKLQKRKKSKIGFVYLINSRNIVDGEIQVSPDTTEIYLENDDKRILKEGDLVISRLWGKRKLLLYKKTKKNYMVSDSLIVVRSNQNKYLYRYLSVPKYLDSFELECQENLKGSIIPYLAINDLKKIEIFKIPEKILIDEEKKRDNEPIKKETFLDSINKSKLSSYQYDKLKKIIESHYESEIIKLSKQAESKNLELKSSFRTDIEKGGKIPPETLINEVLKAICGFCNTSGGDLLIGVNDNNEIIGIEVDGYKNTDKFILTLENHIKDYTKPNILLLPDIISITSDKYEGKTVCRVNVLPCKEDIFLNYKNNKGFFYMRTGAATQRLEGREMIKYVEKKKEKYND